MLSAIKNTVVYHVAVKGMKMKRIDDKKVLAPAVAAIYGVQQYVNSSSLEPVTKELVKIRASQINGCAFCLAMHWREALKAGERVDRLAVLDAWRETNWFTDRERAALAWTERLTSGLRDHAGLEQDFAEARSLYSEQEMVDLTMAIIAINSWNIANVGFGASPEPFEPASPHSGAQ